MPAGQLQVSEIKGTDIGSDFLTGKTGTVTWHVLHSAVPKGCHNDFEVTENLLPSGLTESGARSLGSNWVQMAL